MRGLKFGGITGIALLGIWAIKIALYEINDHRKRRSRWNTRL